VDKVFSNPYRVLGLVSPITSKELAKRTNDLETFVDFGKVKDYPLDMSASNNLPIRTLESIQDAARNLESDNDRVFNALFWFYQYDTVDEIAFEAIENNNYRKAYELWDSQIISSSNPKFSWLINANVISLFELNSSGFVYGKLYEVVERYGSIIKELDKIKTNALQSNKNIVDNSSISKTMIDSLVEYASSMEGSVLELLGAFSGYAEDMKDYAESKIINPYITEIQDVIDEVEHGLTEEESWAVYGLVDKLKDKESLVRALDLYCNNYKVQRVVNDYADTAKRCSVFANNELEESGFAKDIIDWAHDLPAYGEVKNNIADNRNKLEEIIEEESVNKVFINIFGYLETEVYSIVDAEWLLNKMVAELNAIKVQNKKEEDLFKGLAGACAFKIFGKILEIYKGVFEEFEEHPDLDKLNTTIDECYNLASKIQREFLYIDIDSETEESIKKAYAHISSERSDLQQAVKKAGSKKYLPVVATQDKPIIGGVLYTISNITGLNSTYLRVGYVIAALFTGFWPLIVLYAVMTIIKSFLENNAN
jgi:phage shock protein PspC (stress-responsive transcriptional regulator)